MYYIKLPSGEIIEADNRSMEETENQATILTFTLLINSPHFNDFEEFVTKIQAFHEDEKVFEGRVISVKPSMNDSGVFANDIICESELNYLNDAKVGKWDIHPNDYTPEPSTVTELDAYEVYTNMGVVKFLTMLLNNHNAKVLADKRILLGSVTVDDTVYCTTDRETTLNVIQDKLIGVKGGYLRLRKVDGVNHLDYLVSPPALSENVIELAINMKNVSRQNDWHVYTRLIPLGKDGLKISAINGGLDYVEDTTLKAKYGVIETIEKFDNITIADDLKVKAIEKLAELNQKNYAIECGALELSGISGIDTIYKDFKISQYCRLKNSVLNIDELHRIVSKTTNLDNEWDISLKFSNKIIQSTKIATKTEQKLNNLSASVSLLKSEVNSKTSETNVTNIVEQASTLTVTDSTTNGNILVNSNEIQVYSHPANHPPSIILQDANNRLVSDTEKNTWNDKAGQIEIDNSINAIQIGGRNLLLNSKNIIVGGLNYADGSNKEYQNVNIGQTYMDVKAGEKVTISFDVQMAKGNSLQIYNNTIACKKTFSAVTLIGIGTEKTRKSITVTIQDRPNAEVTQSTNFIEFYSIYGTSDWFEITNIKIERGTKATDWTPAIEDMLITNGTRPTATYIGQSHFDTTLEKPIWWNGTVWKDAMGTTV